MGNHRRNRLAFTDAWTVDRRPPGACNRGAAKYKYSLILGERWLVRNQIEGTHAASLFKRSALFLLCRKPAREAECVSLHGGGFLAAANVRGVAAPVAATDVAGAS